MDETDQTMVNTDELAGPVAEEKSTVSGIEPRGDAAAEDSGISPFILDVANPDSCEDALEQAADAIADGECIVLPTDTVYGIGADALNALAVQRLLNAKERGRDMPPPVLVSDSVALPALCQHIPAGAKALAEKYWLGVSLLFCVLRSLLAWIWVRLTALLLFACLTRTRLASCCA